MKALTRLLATISLPSDAAAIKAAFEAGVVVGIDGTSAIVRDPATGCTHRVRKDRLEDISYTVRAIGLRLATQEGWDYNEAVEEVCHQHQIPFTFNEDGSIHVVGGHLPVQSQPNLRQHLTEWVPAARARGRKAKTV